MKFFLDMKEMERNEAMLMSIIYKEIGKELKKEGRDKDEE